MMVYTTLHELVEYILIEQSPLLHLTIQAGSSIRNKVRSHFRVRHFTFPPISSFLVSYFAVPGFTNTHQTHMYLADHGSTDHVF